MALTPFALISNERFRYFVLARLAFSLGIQIQAVSIGWQVYQLTRNPLFLGLVGLAEAIPAIGLAPLAGYKVDRSNPKRAYCGVICLCLASAAILLGVSINVEAALSRDSGLLLIYLAMLIAGVARAFANPALFSLVPHLLPKERLKEAAPWMTSTIQLASVVGLAASGFLISWKGTPLAYAVDVGLLLCSLIFFSRIAYQHRCVAREEQFLRGLQSGMGYVWSNKILLSAMALDMFAVLFGGVTAILPVFAQEILNCGSTGLGILRASTSAGAIAMTLALMRFQINRNAGRILLGVVCGFGFCMIGFALSRNLWLSALVLAISGAFDSVSMVVRTSIVQLSSPDHLRGRIAAVNSIFIGSSNEIGAFESGVAARLLGTVPSVIFGGCMTLLTVGAIAVLAPLLRKVSLEELEAQPDAPVS